MKRNWELIDSIVKTIAESDKDIFGINDFKSAETSEKEIKYTLKLMLDRGLVFDETTRYGVVQVGCTEKTTSVILRLQLLLQAFLVCHFPLRFAY